MKRCPQCHRVETEESLVFCRNDGARLIADKAAAEALTQALPGSASADLQRTEPLPGDTGAGQAPTQTFGTSRGLAGARPAQRKSRQPVWVIAALVIAGLVAALVIGSFIFYRRMGGSEVAIESIAVLPFTNQTNDPETDYLADGLTESTINSLTQLPNLKVIARSTVFRYKGRETDPFKAGKEMGVRAVLTGRLQQRGDDVIVSAELIDLHDNKQLWGDHYQRKMSDLLIIQREIAREITTNLRPKLSGAEKTRVAKDYTTSAEAYQLYLKGRFYWNKRTLNDLNKALPFFDQAIQKDPGYALAYSGLADTYALLPVYGGGPAREFMPRAKLAAQKALSLDDNLAEAHASLGTVLGNYDFDFNGADREYQRAILLNPNYATGHQWRAEHLAIVGRSDEALVEIRRALELDPLSLIVNRVYADILVQARRFDEAIDQYQKTIEIDPNFFTAYFFMGRAYEAKGMHDQAVAAYGNAARIGGFPSDRIEAMNNAYRKAGWNGYLQAVLKQNLETEKDGYVPPFQLASVYARLGEKDQAFKYLYHGLEERDFRVSLLRVSFEFDSLRSDPRYADLVKRIGLPQ
jgi:TolB-like protein/Tfp pilus assembly protein PilF